MPNAITILLIIAYNTCLSCRVCERASAKLHHQPNHTLYQGPGVDAGCHQLDALATNQTTCIDATRSQTLSSYHLKGNFKTLFYIPGKLSFHVIVMFAHFNRGHNYKTIKTALDRVYILESLSMFVCLTPYERQFNILFFF